MNLARIERKYAHIAVTATLYNGEPAVPLGVEVAVLEPSGRPTGTTVWTPSTYSNGDAVVLIAGPDADPTGALTVPAPGGDLWIRVVDNPETTATRVDRIVVA